MKVVEETGVSLKQSIDLGSKRPRETEISTMRKQETSMKTKVSEDTEEFSSSR